MMNKPIDVKSLLLGALLATAIAFSVGAVKEGSNKTTWEYKVVPAKVFQSELERAVNNAAADGWELVSASPYVEQFAFAVLRREKK